MPAATRGNGSARRKTPSRLADFTEGEAAVRSNRVKQSGKNLRAFTLIELMVSIAIIAVLAGLAAPPAYRVLEQHKATSGINWILRAIHVTRQSAVDHGTTTTLCPSDLDGHCGGAWHRRVMVFTDHNADRQINGPDSVVTYLNFPHQGATLKWRSFRNKQYLQMEPTGFTNFQNGNFVYCSAKQEPQFSRQIVLNRQGRVRQTRDRNGDGIVEDRHDNLLRC